GDDVEVVCNRRVGRQGPRIGAGRGGDILAEKRLDARHAAPIVIDCDQSRVAPILSKRTAREIEIDLRHWRSNLLQYGMAAAGPTCGVAAELGERRGTLRVAPDLREAASQACDASFAIR